jgi:SAM-dependent methyltransferase
MDKTTQVLAGLGYDVTAWLDALGDWARAAHALTASAGDDLKARGRLLRDLTQTWLIVDAAQGAGVEALLAAGVLTHLGPASAQALWCRSAGEGGAADHAAPLVKLALRERLLAKLARRDDLALTASMLSHTEHARALLETLRDVPRRGLGERVARLLPELNALTLSEEWHAKLDPDRPLAQRQSRTPLLDHVAVRVLDKLAALEGGDLSGFADLSADSFASLRAAFDRVRAAGLAPCVRAALLFLDFAKGGEVLQRQRWAALGADLSVHNLAAAVILRADAVLDRFALLRQHPAFADLVIALVASHGIPGQTLRGETPLAFLAPFAQHLRDSADALCVSLRAHPTADAPTLAPITAADAQALACDAMLVVNVCDTAGVRDGLMTTDLLRAFTTLRDDVLAVAQSPAADLSDALHAREAARWLALGPHALTLDRLRRLRSSRQRHGEPLHAISDNLSTLSPQTLAAINGWLSRCQFWYAEAATAALSPSAQLKVFILTMQAAAADAPPTAPFNVNFLPLVRKLNPSADLAASYRVRLLEALLSPLDPDALCRGDHPTLLSDASSSLTSPTPTNILGSFRSLGTGEDTLLIDFEESAEARALLTLLPIYEAKSSAAFHATLKALCDLYGLRKDAFDRVANESLYLAHMNSARSDKARMLDFAKPGLIVEVGPGGGVILNLLEDRFPSSDIIGVDISRMVVESLRALQAKDHHRWRVIEADAFDLPTHLGTEQVDTVIFCSLLHEIYSYVHYPCDHDPTPRRFRLESIRDLLRATYKTLKPGGRILIRDGVMPPPSDQILHLRTDDAVSFFKLFAQQFEARPITARWLDPHRVLLSSQDAMEFLYTYTWGPESFPYEVREQYGVLTYPDYQAALLDWLDNPTHPPTLIPPPPDLRSYLQPGYQAGLGDRVALFDASGAPLPLPDSNCLLIIEKGA